MKVNYCFILFFVYSVFSDDSKDEEEANRKKVLDQLTKTRTVLLDDYHLVIRQIATDVYRFRSYRTVSVLFYPIMRDVSDARFTFQAEELHLNNIGSCEAQDVIINLKHGSFPALNPDGYDFPKNFIQEGFQEEIHTIEMLSDASNKTYVLTNPKPGHWYALVYLKWEDPKTQKVEQQGLVADCQTILYTDLQVKNEDKIDLIDCYSGITVSYSLLPLKYKCISLDSTDSIRFNLTIDNISEITSELIVRIQPLSLPTDDNFLVNCAFSPKTNNIQIISFIPHPNAWHYITIEKTNINTSQVANCESYFSTNDYESIENLTVIDLMRDDKGRFFTYDYGLPTTDLQDTTSVLNLTSSQIKTLRFKVNQILDIGGNLAIQTSILMKSFKYYMGYKREINKNSLLAFTEDNKFMRLVVCLDLDHASVPLESGLCKYNDNVKPALFTLNTSDSETIYDRVVIPYPDGGMWYLSFRLFCDDVVCPCETEDNGTTYFVDPNGSKSDEGVLITNATKLGDTDCNATVVLSISSTSCVSGRCSNHGSCLFNTFGGHVMSFCSCTAGYGGWDCSDDSRMDSRAYMLLSVLLLTLSNLLFFISIYVAVIRLYYTEAMIYWFTLVFSTFYHACDAPSQVAYCITRGNILQFGDFYSGLMSFWVTLLAMSILVERLRSFLQLAGAIVIALLTTWNMHSFVAFLLPVALGIAVLLLSWYVDYRKVRKMIYPRSYYRKYMPVGMALVLVGLICYAFLQTEQNYKVVHSIWHMIIAVSVIFLLPDVKRGESVNPFLPSRGYCSLRLVQIFRRPHSASAND